MIRFLEYLKLVEALSSSESTKLRNAMKKDVVAFSYRKKSTGQIRHAKGTLKKSSLPKFAEPKPPVYNRTGFTYFDVGKDQFRTFKRDNYIGLDDVEKDDDQT